MATQLNNNKTYQHKKRYNLGTDKFRRSNWMKSIPEPSVTCNTCSRSLGQILKSL